MNATFYIVMFFFYFISRGWMSPLLDFYLYSIVLRWYMLSSSLTTGYLETAYDYIFWIIKLNFPLSWIFLFLRSISALGLCPLEDWSPSVDSVVSIYWRGICSCTGLGFLLGLVRADFLDFKFQRKSFEESKKSLLPPIFRCPVPFIGEGSL